ncbi:sulfite exporter TauE/SafE family protein [Skermanella mucosa]|uniref:sulfite exporter TauE/SafE family protein n=1 Tax=Skermanella mucosa TaxID=1789672 RepID=UPI00192B7955|nr:sulfite exporter TauE/SafE family protein [Skermanella mucosa]UEM19106.1 sulfite exporter TauE/SafE family protein [Skermanella mucosa]
MFTTTIATITTIGTIIAAIAFLIAGFVKGVIGLGLPTVAIGLLGLVMPPAEAAALLVVPSLVTNVWQLAAGPSFRTLLRRLWPMLVGICIGTWAATLAGADLMAGGEADHAAAALGIALLAYACFGLSRARFTVPDGVERRFSLLVGAATGAVTAATGVFVIPAVPWLQALELRRDDLVQALGLSFLTSTVAMAAGLAEGGAFDGAVAGASLLALVPALAGMALGQRVRTHVRPETFRRCFFLGLLALGGHLALRPLL